LEKKRRRARRNRKEKREKKLFKILRANDDEKKSRGTTINRETRFPKIIL
jgi:hypothetical protein